MCMAAGASGAVRRRREGRLRSWWEHEQQSVKAAVVSALHHSRDVGPAQHQALRGQKSTAEEDVHVRFAPLPGSRGSESALPRACGGVDGFLVVVPPCLAEAGDAHDDALVRFLLARPLLELEEEKEDWAMVSAPRPRVLSWGNGVRKAVQVMTRLLALARPLHQVLVLMPHALLLDLVLVLMLHALFLDLVLVLVHALLLNLFLMTNSL